MKLVTELFKPSHKSIQWHLVLCVSMVLVGAIESGMQCILPTVELAMQSELLE